MVHLVSQDLSVAGRRAGLSGERSGLFMEQIRVTKELRQHDIETNGHMGMDVNPRIFVWENVTGAFSSNDGEDFRIVLEEVCRIADESVCIPRPTGKWPHAGCIMGDGWSVAWRTIDNQFWGTPQRRRRIALVGDFGGQTAPEILFERESVCRDPSQIGGEGPTATSHSSGNTALADECNRQMNLPDYGGGKDQVVYGLDRASFNQGRNAKYRFAVEKDIAQPLVARGQGGGYGEVVGSLCARDYKGVGTQYVREGKVIVQKNRTSAE